jgi:hypothetical protein
MELALAVGSYTWLMARARRLAQGSAPELVLSAPRNLQTANKDLCSKTTKQATRKLPVWHDFVYVWGLNIVAFEATQGLHEVILFDCVFTGGGLIKVC